MTGELTESVEDLKRRNDELVSTIELALKAMNEGEYGTARRILTTGSGAPPMTTTGVVARDGGAA